MTIFVNLHQFDDFLHRAGQNSILSRSPSGTEKPFFPARWKISSNWRNFSLASGKEFYSFPLASKEQKFYTLLAISKFIRIYFINWLFGLAQSSIEVDVEFVSQDLHACLRISRIYSIESLFQERGILLKNVHDQYLFWNTLPSKELVW